jgi:hypothetical protein
MDRVLFKDVLDVRTKLTLLRSFRLASFSMYIREKENGKENTICLLFDNDVLVSCRHVTVRTGETGCGRCGIIKIRLLIRSKGALLLKSHARRIKIGHTSLLS